MDCRAPLAMTKTGMFVISRSLSFAKWVWEIPMSERRCWTAELSSVRADMNIIYCRCNELSNIFDKQSFPLFGIICSLATGVSSVLLKGALSLCKVTNLTAAPTTYRSMLAAVVVPPEDLQLRCASSAGEPLTPEEHNPVQLTSCSGNS